MTDDGRTTSGGDFSIGQMVHVRADTQRRGPVVQLWESAGGSTRYRVYHGPDLSRDYYAEQLEAEDIPDAVDLRSARSLDEPVDADVFHARLTAARLEHPQTDNLYALHSARIQHIPFQFKPLLRLLRSDRPRLLIADEVGVGKTIEAGLILKELQTRQQVDNVLIVCPKPLVTKWRAEMRRFDEDFVPLTADTLRYCLDETHADGAWPANYSRAIVHLELFRRDEYLHGTPRVGRRGPRPGLLSLNPAPEFSLLIIDEAHHLRNQESSSYELANFLCSRSEAAIFLSATPVHLGSRNLFTLLQLLRPDLFTDMRVFGEMIDPNRHITAAMRLIRAAASNWPGAAAKELGAAAATAWGRRLIGPDPRYRHWQARLGAAAPFPDADRVKCLRDLEELHTLAHVMNRTRRRDIGRFTIREPHTVIVPFTPQQRRLYDELIAFRQDLLLQRHDPRIVRLISDTLERQAASCLPALLPTLDGFLETGRFATAEITDYIEGDETGEADETSELSPPLVDQASKLRALASTLGSDDPKWEQLRAFIDGALATDGPGKVLVFSFFLHTLGYLFERLEEVGVRTAIVSGRVRDEERESLRERFRLPRANPDAIDVLLSSEVGCEGLDYEFCDRLVNYDIPWNPMRIEQRIGRIDRFGQQADKVHIYNFITPDTVEERVFFRCFERLGVFRDTVGDLDEVLGDVVDNLKNLSLDSELSAEQIAERARQIADNALRRLDEQLRLEETSGALIGLDRDYTDDVEAVQDQGRFVSPDELRGMIARFIEGPDFGGRLTANEGEPRSYRLRLRQEARANLLARVQALSRRDRQTVAFGDWLSGAESTLDVAFDQATALLRRELPFITPVHPLARAAAAHWIKVGQAQPLAGRLLVHDAAAPPGRYLFICDLWETLAVTTDLRLVSLAWDVDRNCLVSDESLNVLRLLGRAKAPDRLSNWLPPDVDSLFSALDAAAHRRRDAAVAALRVDNAQRVSLKLASLDASFANRSERLRAELAQGTNERIVRMKESELARAESDFRRRRQKIESRQEADIVETRIAVGLLEVLHDE